MFDPDGYKSRYLLDSNYYLPNMQFFTSFVSISVLFSFVSAAPTGLGVAGSTAHGKETAIACRPGHFISRITGRAGKRVHMIQVHCSDGASSPQLGSPVGGKPFEFSFLKNGVSKVDVWAHDNMIRGIQFSNGNYRRFAGTTGKPEKSTQFNGNGNPATSFRVFADNAGVRGISFGFFILPNTPAPKK